MGILLGLVFLGLVAIEAPGLIRNKMWRELIAFLSLMAIGAVYGIGQVYQWPLPNPTTPIEVIFEPIAQLVDELLR